MTACDLVLFHPSDNRYYRCIAMKEVKGYMLVFLFRNLTWRWEPISEFLGGKDDHE